MSRTRKFEIGDVAVWTKSIEGICGTPAVRYFAIIVEYKQDGRGKGRYRVIRTLHPVSGATFGEPAWVNTYNLTPMDVPNRQTAVSIYKANQKLVERGCSCNCCAHEAIPKGQIRKDGTFRWE